MEKRTFWGELNTKANGRRGQRAGMLSRSWLRFVVITALYIATGPAHVNSPQVRPAHLGLILRTRRVSLSASLSPVRSRPLQFSRSPPGTGERLQVETVAKPAATLRKHYYQVADLAVALQVAVEYPVSRCALHDPKRREFLKFVEAAEILRISVRWAGISRVLRHWLPALWISAALDEVIE